MTDREYRRLEYEHSFSDARRTLFLSMVLLVGALVVGLTLPPADSPVTITTLAR